MFTNPATTNTRQAIPGIVPATCVAMRKGGDRHERAQAGGFT